jgi:hypothetical protein
MNVVFCLIGIFSAPIARMANVTTYAFGLSLVCTLSNYREPYGQSIRLSLRDLK